MVNSVFFANRKEEKIQQNKLENSKNSNRIFNFLILNEEYSNNTFW